jgi:hypothetical protein
VVYGTSGGDVITLVFSLAVAAIIGMITGTILTWHRTRLPGGRHRVHRRWYRVWKWKL